MVYRRRAVYRRPRAPRRRAARKRGVSTAVKRYVRKVAPRPELKCIWYNDKEYNLDTLSNQAYVYNFSQLAQGTTRYSRIGNDVIFKGVHIKGYVKNNSTKTNVVRIMIISCGGDVDLSVAGTLDIFAENLAGTGAGSSTVTGLETCYAALNKKYTLLKDKYFKLGTTSATDGSDAAMINMFCRLNNKIKYEGNTYGAGQQNRQIFMMALCSEAADDSAGTVVELSHTTRAWFSDA